MGDPMKIRASMSGNVADVKCLMNHVMETGARRDGKTGQIVAAHHITNVSVTVGGKQVLDAQWGGGVAKNPYLAIKVKGAKAGDKVVVKWEDNKGDSRTDEATVS